MCITKTTLTEASTAVINSPEDFTNEFPSHVAIFDCTRLSESTFVRIVILELIRNLEYRFWNQGIVKQSPEIEKMLTNYTVF